MKDKFTILGIHGKEVGTVEGNVARVRMEVGGETYDEDFELPIMHPSVPKTEEIYQFMLQDQIEARMSELK